MIRQPVLNVQCFVGDLPAATAAVGERARSGQGGFVCLANVHVAVTAQRDSRLRDALAAAWLVLPDGAPLAWLLRRGGAEACRIPGPDLMPAVIERGQSVGLRHFLFGSTSEVVEALEHRLRARFPSARIVDTYAPPIGAEGTSDSLARIVSARPDVVWVALGAPKQELWAARHAAALSPALVVGVGAAFEFLAGRKSRAPHWMQTLGLEWLHRLVREPRRLVWRYVSTNTLFALAVLRRIT